MAKRRLMQSELYLGLRIASLYHSLNSYGECAIFVFTLVNLESGREIHGNPAVENNASMALLRLTLYGELLNFFPVFS